MEKVSPQRPLTLQVHCGHLTCSFLGTFSWTISIRSFDSEGTLFWTTLKNASAVIDVSMNTTQFNLPRLDAIIPAEEGQVFKITAQLIDSNGRRQGESMYIFIVNAPPKNVQSENKGCKVWPTEGSAIITDFHISCLGWYDKDTPLRYAFKYTFRSSTILIQDGNVGNVSSKLPLGDPAKQHERILELQIIDAYGEFTTVYVKTKVSMVT